MSRRGHEEGADLMPWPQMSDELATCLLMNYGSYGIDSLDEPLMARCSSL